jgi:hypothetical protein
MRRTLAPTISYEVSSEIDGTHAALALDKAFEMVFDRALTRWLALNGAPKVQAPQVNNPTCSSQAADLNPQERH